MSELTANSPPALVKDENENKDTPVSRKNVKIVIGNETTLWWKKFHHKQRSLCLIKFLLSSCNMETANNSFKRSQCFSFKKITS